MLRFAVGVTAAAVLWIVGPSVPAGDGLVSAGSASEARCWASERDAFSGPTLNPAWFAGRRVVVYLAPEGADLRPLRRAAEAVMHDRWTEGDWGLKHVVVSDIPAKMRFVARQRLAVREIAKQMTSEAGQGEEFAAENEPIVRDNVFFLWDPSGNVWDELLGGTHENRRSAVVLLDYGGRVVHVIEPAKPSEPDEASDGLGTASHPLTVDVQRLLPSRPELEG